MSLKVAESCELPAPNVLTGDYTSSCLPFGAICYAPRLKVEPLTFRGSLKCVFLVVSPSIKDEHIILDYT